MFASRWLGGKNMSGQIFISYRREESGGWSGRLYDRLRRDFNRKRIFMDIDSIAYGEDFVKAIETRVAKSEVLIAVIGKNWLTSKDERGNRRLDNPGDFVRMEVGAALKRGIRVIPVLVDGASIPKPTDLPEDLKLLVRKNALRVNDISFDGDCQRLTAAIRGESKDSLRVATLAVLAVILIGASIWFAVAKFNESGRKVALVTPYARISPGVQKNQRYRPPLRRLRAAWPLKHRPRLPPKTNKMIPP